MAEPQIAEPQIACLLCKETFPDEYIYGHVADVHFIYKRYGCSKCDFRSCYRDDLVNHTSERRHGPKSIYDDGALQPYKNRVVDLIVAQCRTAFNANSDVGVLAELDTLISSHAASQSSLSPPCSNESPSSRNTPSTQSVASSSAALPLQNSVPFSAAMSPEAALFLLQQQQGQFQPPEQFLAWQQPFSVNQQVPLPQFSLLQQSMHPYQQVFPQEQQQFSSQGQQFSSQGQHQFSSQGQQLFSSHQQVSPLDLPSTSIYPARRLLPPSEILESMPCHFMSSPFEDDQPTPGRQSTESHSAANELLARDLPSSSSSTALFEVKCEASAEQENSPSKPPVKWELCMICLREERMENRLGDVDDKEMHVKRHIELRSGDANYFARTAEEFSEIAAVWEECFPNEGSSGSPGPEGRSPDSSLREASQPGANEECRDPTSMDTSEEPAASGTQAADENPLSETAANANIPASNDMQVLSSEREMVNTLPGQQKVDESCALPNAAELQQRRPSTRFTTRSSRCKLCSGAHHFRRQHDRRGHVLSAHIVIKCTICGEYSFGRIQASDHLQAKHPGASLTDVAKRSREETMNDNVQFDACFPMESISSTEATSSAAIGQNIKAAKATKRRRRKRLDCYAPVVKSTCRLCKRKITEKSTHVWHEHMDSLARFKCGVCGAKGPDKATVASSCGCGLPMLAKQRNIQEISATHAIYCQRYEACFGQTPITRKLSKATVASSGSSSSSSTTDCEVISEDDCAVVDVPSAEVTAPSTSSQTVGTSLANPVEKQPQATGSLGTKTSMANLSILASQNSVWCNLCRNWMPQSRIDAHLWERHMGGFKRLACQVCGGQDNDFEALSMRCQVKHPDIPAMIKGPVNSARGEYVKQYSRCFAAGSVQVNVGASTWPVSEGTEQPGNAGPIGGVASGHMTASLPETVASSSSGSSGVAMETPRIDTSGIDRSRTPVLLLSRVAYIEPQVCESLHIEPEFFEDEDPKSPLSLKRERVAFDHCYC